MNFKTILFSCYLITNCLNSIKACKENWDNTCENDNDCCSSNCDNNGGQWRLGICKPSRISTTSKLAVTNDTQSCLPDWDATCTEDISCCSKICNKDGLWIYGICKPEPTTTTISTTTESFFEPDPDDNTDAACLPDWYDRCKSNQTCCSGFCYNKNGEWPLGVCKPIKIAKTTVATTTTLKIFTTNLNDLHDNCNIQFRKRILELHNKYRPKHDAPELEFSEKLSNLALAYSENLATQDIGLFHSRNRRWGENLARWNKSEDCQVMAEEIFTSWYNESRLFNKQEDEYKKETENFTQMVWKSSKSLGCGISCREDVCYAGCNYLPAGNMGGLFRKNVS